MTQEIKEIMERLKRVLLESEVVSHRDKDVVEVSILQLEVEKLIIEAEHEGFKRCVKRVNNIITEIQTKN